MLDRIFKDRNGNFYYWEEVVMMSPREIKEKEIKELFSWERKDMLEIVKK